MVGTCATHIGSGLATSTASAIAIDELTSQARMIVEGLNGPQARAVTQGDGAVLVFAGAGSGKTRILTRRIAFLIQALHRPARSIMAVTFTNKAADEMKDRVLALVGDVGRDVALGTFHSICFRILRRERSRAREGSFTIYDSDDQRGVMKEALMSAGVKDPRLTPGMALAKVSRLKNELVRPSAYVPVTYADELIAKVYPVYQELLRRNGALDFDDLLTETVEVLQSRPDVLERYTNTYRHILVDEYQDTNRAQYMLVRLLASVSGNLFVVGDADQSIYGWRGADIRNILEFEKHFSDARLISLDQNYRSTQNILDAAYGVISRNVGRTDTKLWTECDRGPLIWAFEGRTGDEEAQFIAREIRRLAHRGSTEPKSCAVMYRTNAQSRAIEDAFIREGIAYRIVGTTKFYERREIKDVLGYLRWVANPADGVSLARVIKVPPRKIGDISLSIMRDWADANETSLGQAVMRHEEVTGLGTSVRGRLDAAARLFTDLRDYALHHNVVETLDYILETTGYAEWIQVQEDGAERFENVKELRSVARRFEFLDPAESLDRMLEHVGLVSEADQVEERGGSVTLLTMHLAKGLEFDAVFLAGMEEGVFPHARALEELKGVEEERRLCYVGITRARRLLYVTYAMSRILMGRSERNPPSRFLLDIPEHLFSPESNRPSRAANLSASAWVDAGPSPAASLSPTISSQSFSPGERVYHKHFGLGVVIRSDLSGGDEEITVRFKAKGGEVTKKISVMYSGVEHA